VAPWKRDRNEIYWIRGDLPAPSLRSRLYASAIICVGWMIFFFLWLLLAANNFTIYRNIAIILLSLAVTVIIIGILWINYGIGIGKRYAPTAIESWKSHFLRGRFAAVATMWGVWTSVVIIWLYFFADRLSGYQNVAIIIMSLLVAIVGTSLIWRHHVYNW